jgi:hypothetical protein
MTITSQRTQLNQGLMPQGIKLRRFRFRGIPDPGTKHEMEHRYARDVRIRLPKACREL